MEYLLGFVLADISFRGLTLEQRLVRYYCMIFVVDFDYHTKFENMIKKLMDMVEPWVWEARKCP